MGLGISGYSVPFFQRAMSNLTTGLSESLKRLSTGSRVNSAKDDAAGVAISTRLQAQIRGNTAAVRNVNDMVSYLQTTESYASNLSENLLRLRDLAVQSANDSLSDADREMNQNEADELTQEISRIVESSQYNGMHMLNNTDSRNFQISWEPDSYMTFSASNLITGEVGGLSGVTASATSTPGTSGSTGGSTPGSSTGGSTGGTGSGTTTPPSGTGGTGSTGGGTGTSSVTPAQLQLAKDQASAATTFLNSFLKFQRLKSFPLMVQARDKAEGLYGLDQISGKVRQSGSTVVLDPQTPKQEAVNAVFEAIQSTYNANIGSRNASSLMVSAAKAAAQVFIDAATAAAAGNTSGGSSGGTSTGGTTGGTTSGGGTTTSGSGGTTTPVSGGTTPSTLKGLYSFNVDLSAVLTFDLRSKEGASTAVALIDSDIGLIANTRSSLGASMNRLEAIADSLTSSISDSSAANSRITDTDYAAETVRFTRSKLLSESTNALMAQANASSKQVLQLLSSAKTNTYTGLKTQASNNFPIGKAALAA